VTPAFILKLALSFLIGGAWVSLGIALAERRGARFGGLVIGFPSTILFTLFFIGWTQSTQAAVRAAAVIPAAHGINALFLLAAVSLLRQGLRAALSVGLGVWFGLALVLVAAKFDGFSAGLLIYVALLAASYSLLGRALPDGPDLPRPEGPSRSTPALILGRGALVGGIIALAVLLTKAAGPLVGGVFAIFPAAFLGTLVATYISRGAAFSASVMRAALLGGISVVVYAAAVRLTYPQLGLGWGTAASTAAALGSTLLIRAVTMKSRT
jgi:uncharacterized membrane protein (GlpM family)